MNTHSRAALLILTSIASLALFCNQPDVGPDPAVGTATGAAGSAGGPAGGAGAAGEPAQLGGAAGLGGAATAGAAGAAPHKCPTGLPGPPLVEIVTPGGAFCIDATEVTQSQYAEFVKATNDDTSGQVLPCYTKSWVPEVQNLPEKPSGCPKGMYDPGVHPDWPMACTSWCMADAYCKWAGKRTCGGIAGAKLDGAGDPGGEWYYACSQGGKTKYPYGDTFDPERCASGPTKDGAYNPLPATDAAIAGCRGDTPPFDQLVNLSGNVAEWESCFVWEGDGAAHCRMRGGSLNGVPKHAHLSLACDNNATFLPNVQQATVGIRCCAD